VLRGGRFHDVRDRVSARRAAPRYHLFWKTLAEIVLRMVNHYLWLYDAAAIRERIIAPYGVIYAGQFGLERAEPTGCVGE
jgi:hypothetical protein